MISFIITSTSCPCAVDYDLQPEKQYKHKLKILVRREKNSRPDN